MTMIRLAGTLVSACRATLRRDDMGRGQQELVPVLRHSGLDRLIAARPMCPRLRQHFHPHPPARFAKEGSKRRCKKMHADSDRLTMLAEDRQGAGRDASDAMHQLSQGVRPAALPNRARGQWHVNRAGPSACSASICAFICAKSFLSRAPQALQRAARSTGQNQCAEVRRGARCARNSIVVRDISMRTIHVTVASTLQRMH
jgi:hypothetical protein